jgi:DNA polymerase
MSKRDNTIKAYGELLFLFEDYVKTGFRSARALPETAGSGTAKNAPLRGDPSRREALEKIKLQIAECTRCNLCHNRLTTVPGEGVFDPFVMVIGEAPGADEDRSGRPFVGAAGQYLDKWLASIGLARESNCFIANIVKCRPPENRDPRPEETKTCLPYLEAQIELISPAAILTVGRVSSRIILGEERGISTLRGGSYFWKKIPVVPTFHPSAVLRDLSLRPAVWEDLKRLKALLDHAKVL